MPSPHQDPFTGEEWVRGPGGALRRPCPPDCVDGYRPVNDLYAIGIADRDVDPLGFAAARNSVYPCQSCNETIHKLWSEGHMTKDHITKGGCDECKPGRTRNAKR